MIQVDDASTRRAELSNGTGPLQQEAMFLLRELADKWLALETDMAPVYSMAAILPSLLIMDAD